MTTLKYERETNKKRAVPLASEHPDYTMTRSMPSAKRFSSKELRGPGYVTLSCSPAELAGRQIKISQNSELSTITCENTEGCLRFLATIRKEFEMKGLYHP